MDNVVVLTLLLGYISLLQGGLSAWLDGCHMVGTTLSIPGGGASGRMRVGPVGTACGFGMLWVRRWTGSLVGTTLGGGTG
eukprot:scaffold264557_cov29-Attheya_sp.AAC.3